MRSRSMRAVVGAVALTLSGALGFAVASDLSASFRIGDSAPALDAMAWIKGEPVTGFKPGHVYVVEFWATWCVPCKEIMPELSELQRKHAGRLTVIGVNARETERGEAQVEAVRKFVERQGEKMDYAVAMDDPKEKTIFNTWMIAAGAYGIPASFVIDGQGRLVWVGHPVGSNKAAFKTAVEQALAGNSDLEAARKVQEEVIRQNAPRIRKS